MLDLGGQDQQALEDENAQQIRLRRFGQDPATASSIFLTTVTDVCGFLSFLGIATLLAGMLE